MGIYGSERDLLPSQGKVFENDMRALDLGFAFWIFPFDLVNLKALCGALGGKKGVFFFFLDLVT